MSSRHRVRVLAVLSVALFLAACGSSGPLGTPGPGSGAGTLQPGNIQYLGAFRVPHGTIGSSRFAYGGTAPGFNPNRNSLFLIGHDHHQHMAEITIPVPVLSDDVNQLPRATMIQTFAEPTNGLRGFASNPKIGGALVDGDRLVITVYEYYDAGGTARVSHLWRSLTLSDSSARGMYSLAGLGAGAVAGYMDHVPAAWRRALGFRAISGLNGVPIISRTSSGPAAIGFNPEDLGRTEPAPAQVYAFYPVDRPLQGWWWTERSPGVAFVDRNGRRGVVFVGHAGVGTKWYGGNPGPGGVVDPCSSAQGTHAEGYAGYFWFYDPQDLAAARRGERQAHDLRPYIEHRLTGGFFANQCFGVGGATYDHSTGRLFVSQTGGEFDGIEPYPLIHVFQIF